MTPKTVQTFAGHASLQQGDKALNFRYRDDEIERLAKETAR
jgi:hypothetical protein